MSELPSVSYQVIEFFSSYHHHRIGQAGMIVLTYSSHGDRLKRFAAWAVVTGLLGLALCGGSKVPTPKGSGERGIDPLLPPQKQNSRWQNET